MIPMFSTQSVVKISRRLCTALIALAFLRTLPAIGAEKLTFDDAATLDGIMARYPGWSYTQQSNGKASLASGVTGKGFAADFGRGYSPVYLTRTLPTPVQTLYIGLSLKVTAVERMLSDMQLIQLRSGGKVDAQLLLTGGRGIELRTNVSGATVSQYPGAYWWTDKWIRYVVGIHKGPNGFVKVWMNGACIYSNQYDTGSNLIDQLLIGMPNGYDGLYDTAMVVIDNLSIGDTFSQVDKEPARSVTARSTIERIVNPDCFGVHLGWYGWGWKTDYPKVKSVAEQMGVDSGRMFLKSNRDWDYHYPYFMYKPDPTDPPGATIQEHLLAVSAGPDPLMMCLVNMMGEHQSTWGPDKTVEQVQFNQLYMRSDGRTGLRSIYELGNELSLYGPVTEGWYCRSDGSCTQIGCGSTTFLSTLDPSTPEYLDNSKSAYNYTLDFRPGDYLYVGQRWRFRNLAYVLTNAAKVSAGDKVLSWEYWDGAAWVRFGTASHCPFVNEYPKPASNFTGNRGWNFAEWDDAAMPSWSRTSMAEISGKRETSQHQLYWIRIGHLSGNFEGPSPVESFIYVSTSSLGYLEGMEQFYPVIADAGAEVYASPGNEGDRMSFLDVMEGRPELFDGVLWHHYPDPPISSVMQPGAIYAPATSMLWSVDRLAERAADLHQMFPGKRIGLSEWNSSGTPTDAIRGLAGGLHTAIGLCRILQSGWDSAMYHALFASFYNPHCLVTENVNNPRLRPAGHAFKAVRDHSKRYVIRTTSSYPGICACAFSGDRSYDGSIVIVNRTPNAESVRLSLPREWRRRLAIFEMTAPSLSTDNETADSVTLTYKKKISLSSNMTIIYNFPPYSLTIFDTTLP